jgi:A/G-specific adenine glycosylase
MPRVMPSSPLHEPLLAWYAAHARDLPWRRPGRTPWGVLVSEVMLQQTPVDRVVPAWAAWLERWPTPAALAADSPGEAVRMWARLGYPRRALRLHAAAGACVERFAGEVPAAYDDLRSLPGVGDYTAAAVLAFAFGQRAVVLDTNVRRVLARVLDGQALPRPSVTVAERAGAAAVLPDGHADAALWSVAVMELGALVCTAASPRCEVCPVRAQCAWTAAGRPAYDGPARPVQKFSGTDRQVRGLLLSVVRDAEGSVPKHALDAVWADAVQRERALDSLVADGLLDPLADGTFALPGR